ncbi:MAG: DUF2059 domain-containing protein [Sphingobium sp.]|nr:DUF2059 domain-containing protein [Sphingobium sp.]
MAASGLQADLDRGERVQRFGWIGQPVFVAAARDGVTISEACERASEALCAAYASRRSLWQQEYERHLNWEYTEGELAQIVAFLESPAGQHYLECERRMNAYIGTSAEHLIEQIVLEAEEAVRCG